MKRRMLTFFAAGGLVGFLLLLWAPAAGADIVTPPGACIGSATWHSNGQQETSTAHKTSDVIEIPAKDTVTYSGKIANQPAVGPERTISGFVKISLPVGKATLYSWGGSSSKYANSGDKKYTISSAFRGIKLKLSGEHRDNGAVTCSGSVFVKIKGSGVTSPLGIASIGVLVVSGGILVFAGKAVGGAAVGG